MVVSNFYCWLLLFQLSIFYLSVKTELRTFTIALDFWNLIIEISWKISTKDWYGLISLMGNGENAVCSGLRFQNLKNENKYFRNLLRKYQQTDHSKFRIIFSEMVRRRIQISEMNSLLVWRARFQIWIDHIFSKTNTNTNNNAQLKLRFTKTWWQLTNRIVLLDIVIQFWRVCPHATLTTANVLLRNPILF